MKFNKPFHIKLVPDYVIKEPMSYHEIEEHNKRTASLGGLNIIVGNEEEYSTILRNGGRMDWHLYNEPDSHNPIVNVNLMRIWALQLQIHLLWLR
jgi:hypothetical protein